MNHNAVTYEQAKLLKEFGFPESDYGYLYLDGELTTQEEYDEYDCGGPFSAELAECETIDAPDLDAVAKWLREDMNVFIAVNLHPQGENLYYKLSMCYYYKDSSINNFWRLAPIDLSKDYGTLFDTYEEALSAGISKSLEIMVGDAFKY